MKVKESVFLFIKKTVEDKQTPSAILSFFKAFLIFISYFNQFFAYLKNLAYDRGILKPKKVRSQVISIGNIVAGGTGKTPFTISLAHKFLSKGYKVAVVSRGYGAKNIKKDQTYVSCLKEKSSYSSEEIGDEPYLISRRLPEVYVIVGSDKIKSAEIAAKLSCDIILLDDGFQSRKLFRDLDVVLLSSNSPFSNGHFLPGGLLRDSKKSLKRADLVVITNIKGDVPKNPVGVSCPVIFASCIFSGLLDLSQNRVSLPIKKIAMLCAIANPESFYDVLKEKGFEIVEKSYLFDHSTFDLNYLKSFSSRAKEKGAEALICTEKDIVKIPKDISLCLPIYYIQMDHKIIIGEEKLEELLQLK